MEAYKVEGTNSNPLPKVHYMCTSIDDILEELGLFTQIFSCPHVKIEIIKCVHMYCQVVVAA